MTATIKWEFIKAFHRLRKLFVFLIALFGVIWIFPKRWGEVGDRFANPVVLLFSLVTGVCILILSLYPMFNVIHDFREKTYALERGTGSPFRNVIAAKMIVNLVVVGIMAACAGLAIILFQKFSTETIGYFSFRPNPQLPSDYFFPILILEDALLYPAMILFSYIVASTGRVFREARFIGTIFILLPLVFLNVVLTFPGILYGIVKVLFITLLLVVTVWLGERRYEQHIYNA